jgi:NitT/TauT family transport system permease protein
MSRAGRRRWMIRAGQAAVPVALGAAWAAVAWTAGPEFLPGPAETGRLFLQGVTSGWLTENLGITLLELAWGFVWAVLIGLPLGLALGLWPLLRDAYEGPLVSLYAVPKVTLFPIFLFLFKLGPESKVAFGAFHGLFPVAILTWSAMRAIKPVHLKLARSLRLPLWQTARCVILPSIAPSLAIGLRLGLNLTFLGVILGEMFGARHGLGYLLMASGAAFDMGRIVVVVCVVALLALAANAALLFAQRCLERRTDAQATTFTPRVAS